MVTYHPNKFVVGVIVVVENFDGGGHREHAHHDDDEDYVVDTETQPDIRHQVSATQAYLGSG